MIGHNATRLPPFLAKAYESSLTTGEINPPSEIFPDYIRIKQLVNSTGAEVTAPIIKFFFGYDFFKFITITSPNLKLNNLRDCLGLNITELASILNVKRPTIYEWLDMNGNPATRNNQRLNTIYKLLDPLIIHNATEFKKYLHNEIAYGENLYSLLVNPELNNHRIAELVEVILDDILLKRNKATRHENKLQSKGFEPVSDTHKSKVLNRLIRKIG